METSDSYIVKDGQKPIDTILGTLLYRKVSIRISRAMLKTNITPNQITILSFFIVLIAALTFFTGEYLYSIFGAILLHLGLIFDCVDGEIARMKSMQSKFGALLDEVLDNFGYAIVFFCLVYGLYIKTNYVWLWMLLFSIVVGILMKSIMRIEIQNLSLGNTTWRKLEKRFGNSKFTLGWGGGFDEFLITFGIVFDQLIISLFIICIGVNAHWIGQLTLNYIKYNPKHYSHIEKDSKKYRFNGMKNKRKHKKDDVA